MPSKKKRKDPASNAKWREEIRLGKEKREQIAIKKEKEREEKEAFRLEEERKFIEKFTDHMIQRLEILLEKNIRKA